MRLNSVHLVHFCKYFWIPLGKWRSETSKRSGICGVLCLFLGAQQWGFSGRTGRGWGWKQKDKNTPHAFMAAYAFALYDSPNFWLFPQPKILQCLAENETGKMRKRLRKNLPTHEARGQTARPDMYHHLFWQHCRSISLLFTHTDYLPSCSHFVFSTTKELRSREMKRENVTYANRFLLPPPQFPNTKCSSVARDWILKITDAFHEARLFVYIELLLPSAINPKMLTTLFFMLFTTHTQAHTNEPPRIPSTEISHFCTEYSSKYQSLSPAGYCRISKWQ